MEGIYGGKILLEVFLVMLCINGAIRAILPTLKDKENEKNNESISNNREETNIGKNIIQLVIMLVIGIIFMCLMIKYPPKILIVIVALFMIIGFLISLFECIKFIFFTPSKFKVTKETENSLWLTGLVVYSTCRFLFEESINIDNLYMMDIAADFLKMAYLTIWYFSVIFFSTTFLILTIHDLVVKFRKPTQTSNKEKSGNYHEWMVKWSSEKICNKAKKEKMNHKKFYYMEFGWYAV